MKDFVITCSSTCDLSAYYLRKHNVYYVSFFYYLKEKKYYDDFYKEHSVSDYYNLIKINDVKTSQPDPNQYKELWLKLIDQGYDILHIELSSGISGAVNSALIAKSMICDINKDAKIYVIDSLCCSTGYGLLIDKAVVQKELGKNIDEVKKFIEDYKLNINHVFMITNLDQLIKGGRISKIAGNIGKILNIVPVLHVDNNGRLEVIKKSRGVNNAIEDILSLSKQNIFDGDNYNDKFFFCHADTSELCNILYNRFYDNYKKAIFDKEYIFNVGTVIGAHTGDGTISVFYYGDGRI